MKRNKVMSFIRLGVLVSFAVLYAVLAHYTKPRIIRYDLYKRIDTSKYGSEYNIARIFENCLVMNVDTSKVYYNGEYLSYSDIENLLVFEDGRFFCNSAIINQLLDKSFSSERVALEDLGYEVLNYNDRMCIVNMGNKDISFFENLYTAEALYLRLSDKDQVDIENAFIDLPYLISNDRNNAVFYSEPNLNLGIQTEIYAHQMNKEDLRPEFVVGEGEYDDNSTLVRVFNKMQTCMHQFLAYNPSVKGGVQVKALKLKDDVLIATVPFKSWPLSARRIRVFNTSGSLCMEIIPTLTAPYVIETGYFTGNDSEQLLITSMYPNSSIKIAIIDIDSAKYVKNLTLKHSSLPKGERIHLEKTQNSKELLVFFKESRKVYILNIDNQQLTKLDLNLPQGANGVYPGKNPGEYIVTVDEDIFSSVYLLKDNSNEKINVGWRENRFYSTFAQDNPDGYVDRGIFAHIRTDLSSQIMGRLADLNSVEDALNNASFSEWRRSISSSQIEQYHTTYTMWEPCFTHRWNWITQTSNMSKIIDEKTGLPKYMALGKDNLTANYHELNSAFLNGSYADGLLPMSKLRLYPLRTFLQDLSVEFRTNPERLVAVSPVHEHEINVAGSIGDYNYYMVLGFRSYLLSLYGSVEKINERFGTNFASIDEIDPPRDENRGKWDKYGGSDYFSYWSLYNRFIVNKRILEAYREALLAGFPPESISAHQIPEGDAVAGFLGEANTRLSPVDVVMSCGTAFGGTRYGTWYEQKNNWLINAYNAGHKNITIGEYSSLARGDIAAYNQLKYLFNHGVRMTHVLVPYPSDSSDYVIVKDKEMLAVYKLQRENNPRPGYTGGTLDVKHIFQDGKSYSVVRIGTGDDQNGLLKSVYDDGSWEGSVYFVPFHSHVDVSKVRMKGSTRSSFKSEDIKNLHHGDQIELTFKGKYTGKGKGKVRIYATYDGEVLKNSVVEFELANNMQNFRYVFSNQLSLTDNVRLVVEFEADSKSKIDIDDMSCTVQRESVARKYFGQFNSKAHKGGITYDILSRELLG